MDADFLEGIIERKHITKKQGYGASVMIFGSWSLLGIVAWIKYGQIMDATIVTLCLIVLFIAPIVEVIQKRMVKVQATAITNFLMQTIIPFIVIMVFLFLWAYFVIINSDTHNTQKCSEIINGIKTYETQYLDKIPLTLADLGISYNADEPAATYSTCHTNRGNFLLKLDYYSEKPLRNAKDKNYLNYYVYQSDSQTILSRLLNDAKKGSLKTYGIEFDFDHATQQEYSSKTVYSYCYDELNYKYLFIFDDTIILLNPCFKMSEVQIQKAVDKFVNELAIN